MALRATDISQSRCDVPTAEHVAKIIAARDRSIPPNAEEKNAVFSLYRLDPREVLVLKSTPYEQANIRLSVSNLLNDVHFENTMGGLCGARGVRPRSAPSPADSLTRLRDLFADPTLDGGLFPKWLLDEALHNSTLDPKLRDDLLACKRIVLPLSIRLPFLEHGITMDYPPTKSVNTASRRTIRRSLSFGDVVWGKTDDADTVAVSIERRTVSLPKAASRKAVWPHLKGEIEPFCRVPLSPPCPPMSPDIGLIVSKAEALPTSWTVPDSTVVLVPGTTTWRKLAQRNIWVHGSFDGLGEEEHASLARSFPEVTRWIKLGHAEAIPSDNTELLPTYRLKSSGQAPSVSTYTHFFWKSGSQFEYYLESNPSMRTAYHGSGPGHTHATIVRHLGVSSQVGIFLGIDDFLEHVL